MQIEVMCGACGGSGQSGDAECSQCRGSGVVTVEVAD